MEETREQIMDAINQTHFPGPLGPRTYLTKQEAMDALLPLASDAPKPVEETPAEEATKPVEKRGPGRPPKTAKEVPAETPEG